MKQITMDYEIYERELEEAKERGKKIALMHINAVLDGDEINTYIPESGMYKTFFIKLLERLNIEFKNV